MLLNMVPLLVIIPLSVLNKSHYSKNRSTSSTTVIVIIIVKKQNYKIFTIILKDIKKALEPK